MCTMIDDGLLLFGLRAGSTFLAGVWCGSANYVTVVEAPARDALPTSEASIDYFQRSFPKAAKMQGAMAFVAALGSVGQYLLSPNSWTSKVILGAGLTLLTVWPWTMAIIMPINRQLMDGDNPKKKGTQWARDMLLKWSQTHMVRTFVGYASFAAFIYGMSIKE